MANDSRNRHPKPVIAQNDAPGAALIGALIVTMIVSLLGTISFRLAAQEVESIKAARDNAVVKHLAEGGINLAVQLFHDPTVATDPTGSIFKKRFDLPVEGPSFFDAAGQSQFRGTAANPDVLFDAANPSHDRILNDPATGWFRALRALGRIVLFKVYAPVQPGLLCTAEVMAVGGTGVRRTIAVQLGVRRIPAIRAGIQIAGNGSDPVAARGLPVWVHWGDIKVRGDAGLSRIEDLPNKTALASVNALSYAEMFRREDRWGNIFVAGWATFLPSAVAPPPPPPSHIHVRQEPLPGLKEDRWSYEELKKQAKVYGEFYVRDRDGLLYQNGSIEPGLGVSLSTVMTSAAVGDHRGLVFIDTLDQQTPRGDNLGTLTADTDYAEGVFIVNANLRLKAKGTGRAVHALSPPNEDVMPMGSRVSVELQGIHLSGVLSVAGNLFVEGRPRLFGALMAGGQVIADDTSSGPLELWTDFELRSGLVRGMPLVYVAAGTWQES